MYDLCGLGSEIDIDVAYQCPLIYDLRKWICYPFHPMMFRCSLPSPDLGKWPFFSMAQSWKHSQLTIKKGICIPTA